MDWLPSKLDDPPQSRQIAFVFNGLKIAHNLTRAWSLAKTLTAILAL